jgi:hypothetical protein
LFVKWIIFDEKKIYSKLYHPKASEKILSS